MAKFDLYTWFVNIFSLDEGETDDVKVWLRKQIKYNVTLESNGSVSDGGAGLQISDNGE